MLPRIRKIETEIREMRGIQPPLQGGPAGTGMVFAGPNGSPITVHSPAEHVPLAVYFENTDDNHNGYLDSNGYYKVRIANSQVGPDSAQPAVLSNARATAITDGGFFVGRALSMTTGSPVAADDGHMLYVPIGDRNIIGQTSGAIAKGSSGTVKIYSGPMGSEADTGKTITAYNRFGDLADATWCFVSWANGQPYIIQGDCS